MARTVARDSALRVHFVAIHQRMAGSLDAPAPPASALPRGLRPLERIASFRFAYLAIFVFLVAYVFTVEALEELLRRYYRSAIEVAVEVDPADGPVAEQIAARINDLLRSSPWTRWGDVRVRPLVLAADARTLLYAGGRLPGPTAAANPGDEPLLPAIVDVDVSLPHNTVLANAVLLLYAGILVTTLVVYTRRLTARQQLEPPEHGEHADGPPTTHAAQTERGED